MSEKLTREEYLTRAMLLGMHYSENGRYFYKRGENELTHRLDQDTLEEVSLETVQARIKARAVLND